MKYQYKTVPSFWKSFAALGDKEKKAALEAFKLFKADPFDPRLNTPDQTAVSALSYHGQKRDDSGGFAGDFHHQGKHDCLA